MRNGNRKGAGKRLHLGSAANKRSKGSRQSTPNTKSDAHRRGVSTRDPAYSEEWQLPSPVLQGDEEWNDSEGFDLPGPLEALDIFFDSELLVFVYIFFTCPLLSDLVTYLAAVTNDFVYDFFGCPWFSDLVTYLAAVTDDFVYDFFGWPWLSDLVTYLTANIDSVYVFFRCPWLSDHVSYLVANIGTNDSVSLFYDVLAQKASEVEQLLDPAFTGTLLDPIFPLLSDIGRLCNTYLPALLITGVLSFLQYRILSAAICFFARQPLREILLATATQILPTCGVELLEDWVEEVRAEGPRPEEKFEPIVDNSTEDLYVETHTCIVQIVVRKYYRQSDDVYVKEEASYKKKFYKVDKVCFTSLFWPPPLLTQSLL